MILINFSHPLTPEQTAQIEGLAGQKIDQVIALPAQFDHRQPFAEQFAALAGQAPLTPEEWQTAPILVILPPLSVIAGVALAELHGRMGYFPPVVRLRPVEGAVTPRFEAAEILNLQTIRDDARRGRSGARGG